MTPEQFSQAIKEKGIQLDNRQKEQFHNYYHMLVEWNEKVNLTSLTSQSDIYLKHFYDSLSVAFYIDFKQINNICDVGAGAGFPSIPLKICYPHLKISIIDSLKKRIDFLSHLTNALRLEDISLKHVRAEDAGRMKKYREKFDMVTARAVARMSVLSELCLPFCQRNGMFVAMKGSDIDQELQEGKKAISTLGGKLKEIHTFSLPVEQSGRTIIVINKVTKTPNKYPRKAGTPNKKPII